MFEADRKTDEILRDACCELLRRGKLLVRGRRRMDRKRLRVPHVRQMRHELE